mgnify:FL=1
MDIFLTIMLFKPQRLAPASFLVFRFLTRSQEQAVTGIGRREWREMLARGDGQSVPML